MDYHEAANFLFDLRRFQVNPGTESVEDLLSELGDPQDDVAFVQIAGSNGKGSTAKMLESILRERGERVGLYTSPHLEDLSERIRVDGRMIPDAAIAEFVEAVKPWLIDRAAEGEPLTFFEAVTAMGIWYFGRSGVDIAVLEVGLGGELDATSAVDPIASCVTTVSLEHTNVLGDTVEEIAATKAKVAPANAPLVTAATDEALDAIRRVAGAVTTVGGDDAADVRTHYGGRVNHTESRISVTGDGWTVDARIPLLGAHQATNAGIAATLARQLRPDLDAATLARGLRNAHWPGRFEVTATEPTVVLDGAHNPDACGTLTEILETFEYDDLHLVFGAMHDKDHREMIAALPAPASVVTCRPNLNRAEDPAVLARAFERAGVDRVEAGGSVAGALSMARDRASRNDCILVTGSLFVVGEARTTFTRVDIPKRIPDVEAATAALSAANVSDADIDRQRESIVHRTITTRVEARQAARLEAELRALGGSCAASALRTDGELQDVVVTGSLTQFERLADRLADEPFGLDGLGAELRATLTDRSEATADGGSYPWDDGTAIMGVLNVTPDSFHDGGEFAEATAAIAQAKSMVDAGVDIIDVGGESTRPGADPVSVDEEIDRLVPVIEAVADLDVAVSVDTRRAVVAEAALDAGADILNDVTGLEDPEMRFVAASRGVPVIVMHSIDTPVVPDRKVDYDDVVEDVIRELEERVFLAEKAGIPRERVVVDPGLGFGKTAAENFELLNRTDELRALGCPVLVGHSHKSMFGLIGRDADDRLAATVAGTTLAAERGVDIVRVHDVAENKAAVDVIRAAHDPSAFGDAN
ncbi:dihydropteroate synthase [Haloferacaceae archaeon DSL9]